jgi:hypothetical protein
MRYMMFIKHAEMTGPVDIPKGLNDAMGEFVGAELASGRLVDTGGLKPTKHGRRIRSHDGRLTSTDGPFTESKEIVGGYAIVKVNSVAEADEVATKFMEIHRLHWPEFDCTCEYRQIDEPDSPA